MGWRGVGWGREGVVWVEQGGRLRNVGGWLGEGGRVRGWASAMAVLVMMSGWDGDRERCHGDNPSWLGVDWQLLRNYCATIAQPIAQLGKCHALFAFGARRALAAKKEE